MSNWMSTVFRVKVIPNTSTNKKSKQTTVSILTLKWSMLLILLAPEVAHAYIDPGSISLIMSSILGFIVAIGYTFRKYFLILKSLFFRSNTKEDEIDGE